MKTLVFIGSLLISTAAVAQAPSSSDANAGPDPNQRICRNMGETGSRLARTRVCLTRREWEERRRAARTDVERAQTTRVERPSGP
jgi:hypothetical protein